MNTKTLANSEVPSDPVERLASLRHEFGEHGGVNMSIEASTTFTVMEAGTMPEIFSRTPWPRRWRLLFVWSTLQPHRLCFRPTARRHGRR